MSFEGFGVLEQRLRRPAGSVLLNILTGIGIFIQVYFSLEPDVKIANNLGSLYFLDITPVFNPTFMLTLVFFPIAYCSILSLWLVPKRVISPFSIQLGTFAVNAIIVLDLSLRTLFTSPFPINSSVLTGIFVFYGFAAAFFQGALGFFQTIFVRWFVGLNIGDLLAQTYIVATDFQTVRKTLLTKTFRGDVWSFHTESDVKDTLVLRADEGIVLVLRKSENGVILSHVPYAEGLYAMETSAAANDVAQSMCNDLRSRLPDSPEFKKPDVTTPALDAVTGIARIYARKRGQSQVAATREIWRRLPRYLKYAISATVIAYAIVSGIFFLQRQLGVSIEFGSYLDLSGYFFLVFVGELGLAGWQEIRHRRRDEEEPEEWE